MIVHELPGVTWYEWESLEELRASRPGTKAWRRKRRRDRREARAVEAFFRWWFGARILVPIKYLTLEEARKLWPDPEAVAAR